MPPDGDTTITVPEETAEMLAQLMVDTVLLGVNIYQAPSMSTINLAGYTAFGLAPSIPIIGGMWIESRRNMTSSAP